MNPTISMNTLSKVPENNRTITRRSEDRLVSLPVELHRSIIDFLGFNNTYCLQFTCKYLKEFIRDYALHNNIIFNFDAHDDNASLDKYVQLIKKMRTNKYLIENISCIQALFKNNNDDWLNNTLRMSINQISFI